MLGLTTKDPFTGTETPVKIPITSESRINNEGPLYGDGNEADSSTDSRGAELTTKDPFTGTETYITGNSFANLG